MSDELKSPTKMTGSGGKTCKARSSVGTESEQDGEV